MNRDDIIKMAQEAGCYDDGEEFCFVNFRHIERFVELVAAYEREKCLEEVYDDGRYNPIDSCRKRIRARSEK